VPAAAGGEIETHSAKGGGDIEAAADFMLGFQNEKEDPKNLFRWLKTSRKR
jgi:hypothetical protein